MDASKICACLFRSYVKVARVSKLKGLKIKVKGSSLNTSIKIKIAPTKIGFFKSGKFILIKR